MEHDEPDGGSSAAHAAEPAVGAELELRAEVAQVRQALTAAQRELQREREREALLRGELQHSVRNMLAVVRSIFVRSVAAGGSLEEIAQHFEGRLDTLARYQLEGADQPGGSADFELMVRDELHRATAGGDPRVTIAGEPVRIGHDAAQLVGLAIHELTTNSIKFGVLSSPGERARLAIRWRLTEASLDISWQETGIPIMGAAPLRYGFGRDFIEEALTYQLDARSTFTLSPGGVECTISIPSARLDLRPLPKD